MSAKGTGKTDVGKVRSSNEDAFYVDDDLGLYVVSDGMGGANAGEVASRLAIETIATDLTAARPDIEKLRRNTGHAAFVAELLRKAIEHANGVILGTARNDESLLGMGCTLTAMVVSDGCAVVGHVGDSRAYVRQGNELRQVTNDHSVAAEMVRAGAMTEDTARSHAFAHVLTRAVGTQESVDVDAFSVSLEGVDGILLCSDGLTDHSPDSAWIEREMASLSLDSVPDALIARANDAGGEDNVTVVVVATPRAQRRVSRGLLGRINRWLDERAES
jgi:protein phosphatase